MNDDLVGSRHSRAGGNPEAARLGKGLDSRFHGNDGKGHLQSFPKGSTLMISQEVVIPAQAGIQKLPSWEKDWIPVSTGMTEKGEIQTFCEPSKMMIS